MLDWHFFTQLSISVVSKITKESCSGRASQQILHVGMRSGFSTRVQGSLSKVWFASVEGPCSLLITPTREVHASFLNANSVLTFPAVSSEIASSLDIKKADFHGKKIIWNFPSCSPHRDISLQASCMGVLAEPENGALPAQHLRTSVYWWKITKKKVGSGF